MKELYRLNIRFDLTKPNERRVYEALQSYDRQKHGSINSLAIKAIGNYLERLERPYLCDFTLDDVRSVVRDELRDIELAPQAPSAPAKPPTEMSEEERRENDRNVLAALDLFS